MPNMEPNEDIEALAGSRNVAMHWGDPSQMVDHLVELAIDRKVYITPTPASIAAQVQLVEPGLVLPRQAPAGLEAPQELHIHVEHCTSTSPRACRNCRGRRTSTQQPPVDLVEDGGQEDRGRRDIQGRQVERRFIRPVRGRQNWLTQALRWAGATAPERRHPADRRCGMLLLFTYLIEATSSPAPSRRHYGGMVRYYDQGSDGGRPLAASNGGNAAGTIFRPCWCRLGSGATLRIFPNRWASRYGHCSAFSPRLAGTMTQ